MKIIVIGSGFGGLTAAIRLAAKGYDVELIEKRDKPGGRAYVYQQDGFTFDGGPTIITAPWLIDELFALAGKKTSDYVDIVPIDPFYNVRFEDGSVFRYNGKRDEVLEQIRKFNPADVEGYKKFYDSTNEIFRAGMALIDQPFSHLSDMARVLPDLIRLGSHRSVAAHVNRMTVCVRSSASTRCWLVATRSRRQASMHSSTSLSRSGACGSPWAAWARW
jgi:phytoene desaturase